MFPKVINTRENMHIVQWKKQKTKLFTLSDAHTQSIMLKIRLVGTKSELIIFRMNHFYFICSFSHFQNSNLMELAYINCYHQKNILKWINNEIKTSYTIPVKWSNFHFLKFCYVKWARRRGHQANGRNIKP